MMVFHVRKQKIDNLLNGQQVWLIKSRWNDDGTWAEEAEEGESVQLTDGERIVDAVVSNAGCADFLEQGGEYPIEYGFVKS